MAIPALVLEFKPIHPRIGARTLVVDPDDHAVRPSRDFPRPCGALIAWERQLGAWLSVEVEAISGTSVTRFGQRSEDLQATLQNSGALNSALAQTVTDTPWLHTNGFATGMFKALEGLRFAFRVETGHQKFLGFAEDVAVEGLKVPLKVVFFHGPDLQPEALVVNMMLQPGGPIPKSSSLLGLDLGNTDTTAAILNVLAPGDAAQSRLTASIPMLTAREVRGSYLGVSAPRGKSIASELRFDVFRSWVSPGTPLPAGRQFPDRDNHPWDDKPNAVEYVIGDQARNDATPARRLIIGAKRMASSRPLPKQLGERNAIYATRDIMADHRIVPEPPSPQYDPQVLQDATIRLDVRAPLELLACRVFQHFREAELSWPSKIALTYPTTYSRFELQALRRAVQRGWLRMQAAGQLEDFDTTSGQPDRDLLVREIQGVVRGPLDFDTQSRDRVIQLMIDEASAAAFFHLYRRIFEEIDGGLASFRYLYEHGLNMLLYDCGGGTTDIALVRAMVDSNATTLRITVLRRSGVRTFGGDDITRQVCRLLKAKLASALAPAGRGFPQPPPEPPQKKGDKEDGWRTLAAQLERYIADVAAADPDDRLVPTKALPGQLLAGDRRGTALDLWRIGEGLKRVLAGEPPDPGTQPQNMTPGIVGWPLNLERVTNRLTQAIYPTDAAAVAQFKKKLASVTIGRNEVDALIRPLVMRSIANCNSLIREECEDPRRPDGAPMTEVHWVVASGNAMKYPLMQELLRQHLAVAHLGDPLQFTFDPNDAKDATAKGAVLALAAMEARGQYFEPRFESDLSDRLPFDVGFMNMSVNRPETLFQEHTPYHILKSRAPQEIPVAQVTEEGVPSNNFILVRKFPGDAVFHKFLAFRFPNGIQGTALRVSYDDEYEYEFRVVDGDDVEGNPIDLTAGETYIAPALRGDI